MEIFARTEPAMLLVEGIYSFAGGFMPMTHDDEITATRKTLLPVCRQM